ncbi:MAG: hypothetical protein JST31_03130 [Actinobacteria bacterium]|nr:hypothetical protein [Actinomycetota bacterium]
MKLSAPGSAPAGASFQPTATAADASAVSLGDVTAQTTFSLTPDGSCTGNVCSATKAGPHTLLAVDGAASAEQAVMIETGALDHLVVSPAQATVAPPQPLGISANYTLKHVLEPAAPPPSQAYTAEGFDAYGNSLGDVTGETTFSVQGGSCLGAVCQGGAPGDETLTASDGAAKGGAKLTVSSLAAAYLMTCQAENYDLDGSLANGCEVAQPHPGITTQGTASYLGEKDCFDSTTLSFSGILLSDQRAHTNPGVLGFDMGSGSAPGWFVVSATGGTFCQDDISLSLTVSGSGNLSCFKLNVLTNNGTYSAQASAAGTASISEPSGSYSDGTSIFFQLQRVCAASPQQVSYAVTGHL